jgi:hypothetical protein
MKLLIMQFSPISLGTKYSPQHPVLKHPLTQFLKCRVMEFIQLSKKIRMQKQQEKQSLQGLPPSLLIQIVIWKRSVGGSVIIIFKINSWV